MRRDIRRPEIIEIIYNGYRASSWNSWEDVEDMGLAECVLCRAFYIWGAWKREQLPCNWQVDNDGKLGVEQK